MDVSVKSSDPSLAIELRRRAHSTNAVLTALTNDSCLSRTRQAQIIEEGDIKRQRKRKGDGGGSRG